jgi:hypothetical protein
LDPLGKINQEFIQKNINEEKRMTICDGTVQFLDLTWQGEVVKELDEILLFTKYQGDTDAKDNIFHIKIAFMSNSIGKLCILILDILSAWLNIKKSVWAYEPIVEKSIEYNENKDSSVNITDRDLQHELVRVKSTFPVGATGPQGPTGISFTHYNLGKYGILNDWSNTSKEEEITQLFDKLTIPSEYTQKFIDEKVWVELIPYLQDSELKELVDKMGYRLKLREYINSCK